MTITQLEYFIAVVNHGSFSTAAEHCFVTQPSLSTQISNLESELGVILLDRNSKPIVPTETGRAVFEQASIAVKAFLGTRERVDNLKGELSGKLRLGVLPSVSPYLMPAFIPRFTRKCPDVKLEIRDMITANLVDSLGRDMIDIAILSGGQSEIKIYETKLFDDKLYLYVSPDHELFNRKSILIEEVDARKLYIMSDGICLRNPALDLCRERKKANAPFDFVNCSMDTLMHLADTTGGITIIPGMSIGHIPKERRDQIKPFCLVNAHRKITMAVSATFIKECVITAVRESVLEVAREEFALSEFLIP